MPIETFTKALADETRLRLLILLIEAPELCVCEFTQALALSQPKVSRHLAILREAGLLQDRREGLWVYYRLHKDLPEWARTMLQALYDGGSCEAVFQADRQRLASAVKLNQNCLRTPRSQV